MPDGPSPKRRRLSSPGPRRLSNTSERPSTNNASDDDDEDSTSNGPSDAQEFTVRRGYTFKRSGEPPKNDGGKYVCKVDDRCRALTFDRKCEWGKHMDKHERPYRCDRPECLKLNGFTYSGGLLRHQREVHKMHGSTVKLFCPETNCKRSSGSGFTRRENLFEHLRRVHRRTSTGAQDALIAKSLAARGSVNEDEHHKVKEPTTPTKRSHEDDDEEDRDYISEPSHEVRTLRQQITQRDKTIRDQYARIQTLEKQLEELGRDAPS